jgi:hypothetical protein
VSAAFLVQPDVPLNPAQRDALEGAALTLPNGWTVIVSREDLSGDRFNVRVIGVGFATVAGFSHLARPDELAAFAEPVRRENA